MMLSDFHKPLCQLKNPKKNEITLDKREIIVYN